MSIRHKFASIYLITAMSIAPLQVMAQPNPPAPHQPPSSALFTPKPYIQNKTTDTRHAPKQSPVRRPQGEQAKQIDRAVQSIGNVRVFSVGNGC